MKHLITMLICVMLAIFGLFSGFFYIFAGDGGLLHRLLGALVIWCFSGALVEWAEIEKKRFTDTHGKGFFDD